MDLKSEVKNVVLSSLKEPSDIKIGIEIENIIYNDKNERIMVTFVVIVVVIISMLLLSLVCEERSHDQ